eukprot:6789813-Alexandrium_andersonii.AAC.1
MPPTAVLAMSIIPALSPYVIASLALMRDAWTSVCSVLQALQTPVELSAVLASQCARLVSTY